MADDASIVDGVGTYDVAADDDGSGNLIQLFKLAYSADNNRTHVPADASGLLVNLGTNNDVTVTGTVDLGSTDSTALASIETAVEAVQAAVEGTLTVSGTVAVTNAALTELAGAIADTEVQVDVVGALPAGTNSIGTVALSATDNQVLDDIESAVDGIEALIGTTNTTLGTIDTDTGNIATTLGSTPHVVLTDGADNLNNNTNELVTAALGYVFDGSTWHRARGDSTNGLLVNLGANNEVTVSGVATAANQTTIIGHIDGIEALLTTIDADTSAIAVDAAAIEALLTTIDADTGNIATAVGNLEFLDLTNSDPLAVAIVDGDGTQITSFGGGTQYTEGDTDATITGTAVLWEDTSNTLATVSGSSPLPVAIISGAGSGGTASDDDADFTAGTTAGTPVMGAYDDDATAVTDNDMGIVRITSDRKMHVTDTASQALLTTIDADTGGILTSVQTLDNAIDGTEMQVDVVAALPAGNNNIGDVDIASIAAGDNNIGNVDVASSALPTGASTSANQSTIIGHVDGIEALLTTIDTDTSDIHTNSDTMVTHLATIAGDTTAIEAAVEGTLTVGLPTGASTAANQTTIIGHLDGVEAVLGTIDADTGNIATEIASLSHAEDSQHSSGHAGVMALGVSNEVQLTFGADGDYTPIATSRLGSVYVEPPPGGSIPISGADSIATPYFTADLDEDEEEIETSAVRIFGWSFTNEHASTWAYVKFFNDTAGNVSVGTTTPDFIIGLPPGGGAVMPLGLTNISFDTALCIAAVTTAADAGSTGPAGVVAGTVFYSG